MLISKLKNPLQSHAWTLLVLRHSSLPIIKRTSTDQQSTGLAACTTAATLTRQRTT